MVDTQDKEFHLLIQAMNSPVPRYTSYPTAQDFEGQTPLIYQEHVRKIAPQDPISLYLHIPFCHAMCLFCACSVILNRNREVEQSYVEHLEQEISLLAEQVGKRVVTQLHFGGGTPTKLSPQLLSRLMQTLQNHFQIDFSGDIAMEVDPRTVAGGEKLALLKSLGFNRLSFGVQDLSEQVQQAVRRYQTEDMTRNTIEQARLLGFLRLNLDLIYGLPHQNMKSFEDTAKKVLQWRPDRIALFSYACVPHLKPHQKAIDAKALPSTEEKFSLYARAREIFLQGGYVAIGMDHFALPGDPLAQASVDKTMVRNFQGYAPFYAPHILGLGVTAIGSLQSGYFQNVKSLQEYAELLHKRQLPVFRGKTLSNDDAIRRFAIQSLMCRFELSQEAFHNFCGLDFKQYFFQEWPLLQEKQRKGLLEITNDGIYATSCGRLFIRNIAHAFDAYRKSSAPVMFSKGI